MSRFQWAVVLLLALLTRTVLAADKITATADIINPTCTLDIVSPVGGTLAIDGPTNSHDLNQFLDNGTILADNSGGHDIQLHATCGGGNEPLQLTLESHNYASTVGEWATYVFGNSDPNVPGAVGIGVVAHMKADSKCTQPMSFDSNPGADCVAQPDLYDLPLGDAGQAVDKQVYVRVGLAAIGERSTLRTGNISVPLTFRMEFK